MKQHRPYSLQEYDPQWKEVFIKVAEELRPVFGTNLVKIEHVGSTSIEGMLAKPQIDVLVVVKDLSCVEANRSILIELGFIVFGFGYVSEEDYSIAKDADDGTRRITIHTLQEGNPKIERYKIFQDYMRTHKEERELYARAKLKSYALNKDDYGNYYKGKEGVLNEIMARAYKWADAQSS